jgi:RNA polymerase sigma-70 factor, ECF subfamily
MDGDHPILEQVRKGDINAFATIVKRHQKPLICVIVRLVGDLVLAEDIVQEAFMKAFQKLDSFEGRSKFKSWLFQIAINTARNRLRTMKTEMVDIDKVKISSDMNQESDLSNMDLRQMLNKQIQNLPPKQRLALSLRIYDDMSFAEIAEIMECPYDTAKANYRHALMKLKDKLGGSVELRNWGQDIKGQTVEAEL